VYSVLPNDKAKRANEKGISDTGQLQEKMGEGLHNV
jgi:hypothetical protein